VFVTEKSALNSAQPIKIKKQEAPKGVLTTAGSATVVLKEKDYPQFSLII
jgi:hypothetical protein